MSNLLEEDLGGDSGLGKKKSAKKGRRAKKSDGRSSPPQPIDDLGGTQEEIALDEKPIGSEFKEKRDGPPKPSRRIGGWGEQEGTPTKSARRRGEETMEDEAQPKYTGIDQNDSDSDPDIPVIPDLDDPTEEETVQVAVAPSIATSRVATYKELDNDLVRHAAFSNLDNEIDMKLLTKVLAPQQMVNEPDVPWDWDILFTEVSSDLTADWEKGGTEE